MKRVIFDILLFTSVFIFPWWISLFLVLIGIFVFKNFYEYIIVSVIVYSLYAVKGEMLISFPVLFSAVIIGTYVIIQYIRDNIIYIKNKNEI